MPNTYEFPWVDDIRGVFYELHETYEPVEIPGTYDYESVCKIQAAWRRHQSRLVLPIKRMSSWIENIVDGN
jgi:hypothetical protein